MAAATREAAGAEDGSRTSAPCCASGVTSMATLRTSVRTTRCRVTGEGCRGSGERGEGVAGEGTVTRVEEK